MLRAVKWRVHSGHKPPNEARFNWGPVEQSRRMRKFIFTCALALSAAAHAQPMKPVELSPYKLYLMCADPGSHERCADFIIGVALTLEKQGAICIPDQETPQEIISVALSFLPDAKLQHYEAVSVLGLAFSQAYPCGARS